jgi:Ni/Co efflux regulator RcnB
MKRFDCAVLLGLSLLIMHPAFAAPPTYVAAQYAEDNDAMPSSSEERQHYREQRRHDNDRHQHRKNFVWQAGATLPEKYRSTDNYVDYTSNAKLTAPTRYQQWLKIKKHYILFNVLTNTIIKIVHE